MEITAKAKITITGQINDYRINPDDGVVNCIIKADTSKNVPSGLKEIGESAYNLSIGPKMWKKHGTNIVGKRIMITGEPKACVSQKGTPFIKVNCFDISVIESKNPEQDNTQANIKPKEIKEKDPKSEIEVPKSQKPTKNSNDTKVKRRITNEEVIFKQWRIEQYDNVTEIPVSSVVLTEKDHLRGFNTNNFMHFKRTQEVRIPIIIRPIENGKYSLVSGFKSYIIAKIFNLEILPAIITDLTKADILDLMRDTSDVLEVEKN